MTGAELIIRRPTTFSFMSVRHDGQWLLDWLKTKPKLTGEPQDIINSWLDFHKPGFGDNRFTKNRRPVTLKLKTAPKAPGDYFHKAMDKIQTDKLKGFTESEKSEITCSYGDYQVIIQHGKAYLRRDMRCDTEGVPQTMERWLTVEEYLLDERHAAREYDKARKAEAQRSGCQYHPH